MSSTKPLGPTPIIPVTNFKRVTTILMEVWVKAGWAYDSSDSSDLSFSAGALIRVIDRAHPDWWRGQTEGRTGLFPSNYAVAIPLQGEKVEVLFDFDAGSDFDLQHISSGQTLEVLERPTTGWWLGRLASGEIGLFPANYVAAKSIRSSEIAAAVDIIDVAARVGEIDYSTVPIIRSLSAFDLLIEKGFVVELEGGTRSSKSSAASFGMVVRLPYCHV
jgi:hypothetical protein